MSLSIGIAGLPNVGKSTTFNALIKEQRAQVANYPFCTIEPNRAVVPIPDERVDQLAAMAGVPRAVHASIEFLDIAGLVQGASRGEGLGNKFLAQIRDADAIVHVVRCFRDPNVVHVSERPDPRQDIETINTELALADLEQVDRKIERLSSQVKGDKKVQPILDLAMALRTHLDRGLPVSSFPGREEEAFIGLNRELRFLTGKPVIYAANVDEDDLAEEGECVMSVREAASVHGAEVVKVCARLEEALAGLSEGERNEYLALSGAPESGLDQVIRKSYKALNMISFFTMNDEEVRAWTIPAGTRAPQAAGKIHTDFERGFIRAEVIPYETFIRYGSGGAARAAGEMRIEGKDYVVQDGDVIFIRFNV